MRNLHHSTDSHLVDFCVNNGWTCTDIGLHYRPWILDERMDRSCDEIDFTPINLGNRNDIE